MQSVHKAHILAKQISYLHCTQYKGIAFLSLYLRELNYNLNLAKTVHLHKLITLMSQTVEDWICFGLGDL